MALRDPSLVQAELAQLPPPSLDIFGSILDGADPDLAERVGKIVTSLRRIERGICQMLVERTDVSDETAAEHRADLQKLLAHSVDNEAFQLTLLAGVEDDKLAAGLYLCSRQGTEADRIMCAGMNAILSARLERATARIVELEHALGLRPVDA